ncbi:MAG: diacylglycerol kinase family protein [bacterium]
MLKHTISFRNAFCGIWTAIITQNNIRVHFIIASLVIFSAAYLHLSMSEILMLILTIGLVMVAEMVNTAIEFFCDAITLEHNEYIKQAKDVSAGAVLISAIFAALIGIIIFVPKLL